MIRVLALILSAVEGLALLAGAAQAQQVPHPAAMSLPATNAALKAINGGINLRAVRLGFTAAGDGGYAEYNWSASNCAAADDGAQVQPSVTGCWIADFSGKQPTPMVWGAKGDGVTDDTVAVQASINALAGQTLHIGPHKYCIGAPGLVVNHAMAIEGSTPGFVWNATNPNYGFVACAVNLNMLRFNYISTGSRLSGVFFDAGAAGDNTSGAAITTHATASLRVENVAIYKACIGIDDQLSNQNRIEQVFIHTGIFAPGCGGIRIGAGSTAALHSDLRIDGVTIDTAVTLTMASAANYGILVLDAGGLQIHNADILFAQRGLAIEPGADQQVVWLFASDSALSDTTCQDGIYINPTASTGIVSGLSFNGTWSASAGVAATGCIGSGVRIENTNGGTVKGVHFVGHRAYANKKEGFYIGANTVDVTIDASRICDNSVETAAVPAVHYDGIAVAAGAGNLAIRNNRIAPSCTHVNGTTQITAIKLYGGNHDVMITGNVLRGSVGPVTSTGAPLVDPVIINNNLGYDDAIFNVPAAATLPMEIYPTIALTGASATITNVTGGWANRHINIFARDATQTFVGGGANQPCNNRTLTVGQFARATYLAGLNCLYISPP